ncbi:MAG: hypothetical protein HKN37_12910 [Rhodothermales bacterium]|nr:hypothetical protein [Rhodothermales bacterium]
MDTETQRTSGFGEAITRLLVAGAVAVALFYVLNNEQVEPIHVEVPVSIEQAAPVVTTPYEAPSVTVYGGPDVIPSDEFVQAHVEAGTTRQLVSR